MLPQRPISSRIPSGSSSGSRPSWASPSKSFLPQRGIPKFPIGTSPKAFSGGLGARSQKTPPPVPTSFFGTKRDMTKLDLRERIRKVSPYILKGKMFTKQDRVKMIEQWFPYQKFGTHIKETEARRALRGLRRKEALAKPREKKPIKYSRKLLEAFTGIRKY